MTAALTDRQQQLLEFERDWWVHAGEKEAAIKARFGMAADAYQAELDRFIFTDVALAHDRPLVLRLRRLSAQHQRQRAHR